MATPTIISSRSSNPQGIFESSQTSQRPSPTPIPMPHRLDIDPSLLSRVNGALDQVRAGRMVILVDDEDRENEGDLTMAADKITPEAVSFMAVHGRGLICLALTEE